jgi:hypothetical protein
VRDPNKTVRVLLRLHGQDAPRDTYLELPRDAVAMSLSVREKNAVRQALRNECARLQNTTSP